MHLLSLPLLALLSLVFFPVSAVGGYDIAHILERTCVPGGPLIVADDWKSPKDRDRVMTKPGEVIACPPEGPRSSFQIAAGPERIGRRRYFCTYFSLIKKVDGDDTCFTTDLGSGAGPFVKPLMTIRADDSGPLALSGIVSDDAATVAIVPRPTVTPEPAIVPVDRTRATRLGASRSFGYFSLTADRGSLCAEEPARLFARDSSGNRLAEHTVPLSTRVLDLADRAKYARSLKTLCGRGTNGSVEVPWLTEMGALLRSFLGALI